MMRFIRSVAPPNSLILIAGRASREVPESMRGMLVAATSSCIAVGTLSEHDGSTQIVLTDEKGVADRSLSVAFEGVIDTPSLKITVSSVQNEVLLTGDVATRNTRVRVLANDTSEPDQIVIFTAPAD